MKMAASGGSHIIFLKTSTQSLIYRSNGIRRIVSVKSKPRLTKISCCRRESIDFDCRTSPAEVKREIERCYELIRRLGRGVVYLGSSRMGANHPHYSNSLELGREVANLLSCTSWTGVGPGLMDAAIKGAMEAGKPVAGFKIVKEAGEWTTTNIHPYLPSETYLTCRFFSARKHGLVDAAVRNDPSDKTAVIGLPGGIGTLDEIFEVMSLIQLQRIGSNLPVPFLLMNYDGFYSKLLEFLEDCQQWGTVSKGEVDSLWKAMKYMGFGSLKDLIAMMKKAIKSLH